MPNSKRTVWARPSVFSLVEVHICNSAIEHYTSEIFWLISFRAKFIKSISRQRLDMHLLTDCRIAFFVVRGQGFPRATLTASICISLFAVLQRVCVRSNTLSPTSFTRTRIHQAMSFPAPNYQIQSIEKYL